MGNPLSQSNVKKKDKHPGGWENSVGHKVLRSRRRARRDSDKHFGSIRGGIVLNKLPSDLVGNVKTNFQNLEFYLGRVSEPRVRNDQVVYIPTGESQ